MSLKEDALAYHSMGRPGKVRVVPTKPTDTAEHMALAYTPGVAEPCLEIERTPEDAYRYTSKGNLVAVISNGTAVLGLGNIGALAGKPVMEGKGVLFKRFAGCQEQEAAILAVVKRCELPLRSGATAAFLGTEESAGRPAKIVLAGNTMDPEASVSALVLHHPDAKYFSAV